MMPNTKLTATDVLDDRLLVHTNRPLPEHIVDYIAERHSGVVLTGRALAPAVGASLRANWPDLVVTEDQDSYHVHTASIEDPVVGGADGLRRYVGDRDDAAVIVAPSGFIEAQDGDALKALIEMTNAVDDSRLVVPIAVRTSWLRGGSAIQLASVIATSRHPAVVVLCDSTNPFDTKGVLEQFRSMSSRANNILLARSDLAGLDLIARSCGIASTLGLTGGLRHGLAPGMTGFAVDPKERRAQIFDRALLRYFRAKRLNEVYTVISPPGCPCAVCDGRPIDRFTADPESKREAEHHNIVSVLALHDEIAGFADRVERHEIWRQVIREAIARHANLSMEIGQPLKPPISLDGWGAAQED